MKSLTGKVDAFTTFNISLITSRTQLPLTNVGPVCVAHHKPGVITQLLQVRGGGQQIQTQGELVGFIIWEKKQQPRNYVFTRCVHIPDTFTINTQRTLAPTVSTPKKRPRMQCCSNDYQRTNLLFLPFLCASLVYSYGAGWAPSECLQSGNRCYLKQWGWCQRSVNVN